MCCRLSQGGSAAGGGGYLLRDPSAGEYRPQGSPITWLLKTSLEATVAWPPRPQRPPSLGIPPSTDARAVGTARHVPPGGISEPQRDGSLGAANGPRVCFAASRGCRRDCGGAPKTGLLSPGGLPQSPARPRSGGSSPEALLAATRKTLREACPQGHHWRVVRLNSFHGFGLSGSPQNRSSLSLPPGCSALNSCCPGHGPQSSPGMEGCGRQGSAAALRTRGSRCNSPFTSHKRPAGSWGRG